MLPNFKHCIDAMQWKMYDLEVSKIIWSEVVEKDCLA